MANFALLFALLTCTVANPTIVSHFDSKIFIPLFHPFQYKQHNYKLHQQIDRSDQENQQTFASDQSVNYSGFDNHEQYNNVVAHEDESQPPNDFSDQQQHDYMSFTEFNSGRYESNDDSEGKNEAEFEHQQHVGEHHYVQSVPVSEHVEVTKPITVPIYKEIGIPVPHPVKINVPHPVTIGVPQPFPVAVPVSHPVPIHITKTIAVPVEKKVPYPVEKHIPVPVEKLVPIKIEKHIPVPVYKPYPIKIPVYKTIYHHPKEQNSHSHGHIHSHSHTRGH